MSDPRSLLERESRRFIQQGGAFERLGRRRDRKRRNQRITAGVVGLAVFVAAVWIVTSLKSLDRSDTSVVPGVSGTTGPAVTGPAVTGPAVTGPGEIGPAPVPGSLTDYLLDPETHETTPLPKGFPGEGQNGYAISPDGSEVAYYLRADWINNPAGAVGAWGLFVAHIDGTHVRQIADDAVVDGGGRGASDTGPAWSPDGTKIAYTGLPSGDPSTVHHLGDLKTNVFVVDLASGVNTQVTFETVHVSGSAFSPDGSSIVYTAYLLGGSEVRIAPVTGGEGSTLVGGHGTSASAASFSPDGSLLSYICADPAFDPGGPLTHNRDLCLANADGSDPRVIAQPETRDMVGGIVTASWSPDGSRLAFWTFDGIEGVWILELATGQTTCVAGCEHVGAWPIPAWPGWLDDHTLFIESYHGPH